MAKILMGPQTYVYPMPAFLVGANIDDKPNFLAVAWSGIANSEPPMISVAIHHSRSTFKGIHQNLTFSVNVPSIDLVREVDYCGITHGSKVNKVDICGFKIFYGKLGTAPMIEQCPINLECSLVHFLDLGSHSLAIGKIEETYVAEECLTDGKPDIEKIKPLAFMSPPRHYQAMGKVLAKAFSIGKELRSRETPE